MGCCSVPDKNVKELHGGTVMEEIKDILLLFSAEIHDVLKAHFKKMIVYGSYARGNYNENSDIDIMVLTSLPEEQTGMVEDKLYDAAFDFLMRYGVNISVIVKNEEHFNYWLGVVPFYDNVEREGVVISE